MLWRQRWGYKLLQAHGKTEARNKVCYNDAVCFCARQFTFSQWWFDMGPSLAFFVVVSCTLWAYKLVTCKKYVFQLNWATCCVCFVNFLRFTGLKCSYQDRRLGENYFPFIRKLGLVIGYKKRITFFYNVNDLYFR